MKARKIISSKATRKKNLHLIEECAEPMSRIEMIQMLIPLGLQAVEEVLQNEVNELVGTRYERNNTDRQRWGSNKGSVYLGDQKVSIPVPRVRDTVKNEESVLTTYKELQSPQIISEKVFRSVINGLSSRKYEKVAEHIPETFGIKKSSVSKKFISASGSRLKEFMNRDLSKEDIVAIFIDGKHLAEVDILIAIGITIDGQKRILDFVETHTENFKVCKKFIQGLADRGLDVNDEILFVIDGAKGLYKGIKQALGERAFIQRCQWHKRENILSYLGKEDSNRFRRKLQKAYENSDYKIVKQSLAKIRKELLILNESAANSLDEGLEETLTLHRLGLFGKLGKHFKTTNCIESINSQINSFAGRVSYWKTSNQRRRWIASISLEIEPSLRKIKGFMHLRNLRVAMKNENIENMKKEKNIAA